MHTTINEMSVMDNPLIEEMTKQAIEAESAITEQAAVIAMMRDWFMQIAETYADEPKGLAYVAAREALSTPPSQALSILEWQRLVANFIYQFKRHVGGDGEFWLHELEDFYHYSVASRSVE
jgi:hypothetical protein